MNNTCPAYSIHRAQGIPPIADAFDTTQYTDTVDASVCKWICFYLQKGVGATGTSTLTVVAADDTTGTATTAATNETAIVFKYRVCTTADTWGALTDATTSGFATTAGSNGMVEVWVDSNIVAATGYRYCRLKAAEVVNSPVLAGVTIECHGLRYAPQQLTSIP